MSTAATPDPQADPGLDPDQQIVTVPLTQFSVQGEPGQARIITARGSKFVVLELFPGLDVPGEADLWLLAFRKLWPIMRAQFYVHFLRQAARAVEARGKLMPDGTRLHPVRLNEPGQYTEAVAWLTADQCFQIADALDRQARFALGTPRRTAAPLH